MATPRPLRPLVRPALAHARPTNTRRFLPNPFASSTSSSSPPADVQTLRASRTLPYPSAPIYSIIADVPAYAAFLPYCTRSTITHWSAPDALTARRWPSIGVLTSGFGSLTESFTSRVYCVPGRVVESVGGLTTTALPRDQIAHHLDGAHPDQPVPTAGSEGLLTHLRNTWTVDEIGPGHTRIELVLEFRFQNPLYAAVSAAAAPKVADAMVRAFEERVRGLLTDNPAMVHARLEDLDGSRLRGGVHD
ncbi:polyketide cyclase dehydrase and lipid transporter [Stagonosporopsis vannaccii]|nr:polyketide cyclase dehydrase and lipid transporter [Stagonosporopsis vannaccii]